MKGERKHFPEEQGGFLIDAVGVEARSSSFGEGYSALSNLSGCLS